MLLTLHSTGGFLKKTILFSGFQNPYKKSAKKENSSLFLNSIFKGKMRVETRQKLESEKT
jgi:hypothetical protein